MNMTKNQQDLYKLLSTDEKLLRLLYYLPKNAQDDPFSPNKPNILSLPDSQKWSIIEDVLKFTPTYNGLDSTPKCRLLFYPGRRGNTYNYLVALQEINIDVFVHYLANDKDLRLSRICDRVNELLSDEKVTGIGNVKFVRGINVPAPDDYLGYNLVFSIGSGKK